jgi:hypothetical protein
LSRFTDGVSLTRDGDKLEFQGNVEYPTSIYALPATADSEITKTESPDATKYKIKLEGSVAGPNTQIVEVDKKTGDWNVKKLWMGFFPASLEG